MMSFVPSFKLCFLIALMGGTLFSQVGCASTPFVWANEIPRDRAKPDAARKTIESGDVLLVTVVAQAGLSGQHVVGVDGTIALPNLGAVLVGGQTTKLAENAVKKSLSAILAEPQVSIVIVSSSIEVNVLGEVARPGRYQLKTGDGVTSALAVAGGITEFGDEDSVYLVRSGEALRIRFRLSDLVRGGESARAFSLREGDLLVIE